MNTFENDDARRILQIPVPSIECDDQMVWRGEHSGEFSIRSAYKILQTLSIDPSINNLQNPHKSLNKSLWNLNLPSKLLITIWRISKNFILSFVDLQRRRLVNCVICPRCEKKEESLDHIFRFCPVSIDIWSRLSFAQILGKLDFNFV